MSEENITKYVLMNKNTPVLEFEYSSKDHAPIRVTEEINLDYAPLSALSSETEKSDIDSLKYWWGHRSIPASRQHLRFATDSIAGTSEGEINKGVIHDLIEKNHALSLSDQYWINDVQKPRKWKDINFFHNKFSDDIGNILIGAVEHLSPEESAKLKFDTPDGTAEGNLMKRWKIAGEKRILLKRDSDDLSRAPYNELIATKLYETLLDKSDFVEYGLLEEKGQVYSVCENMLTDSEELISASQIFRRSKSFSSNAYDLYALSCENLGVKDIEEKLSKMVACDFILANIDRHLNNFGLVRDVETLKCKIAPIFDNGYSLFLKAKTLSEISTFNFKMQAFTGTLALPTENVERFARDLSWFEAGKLKGFGNVAKEILMSSRFAKMPPDQYFDSIKAIDNICYGLERRIDFVRERQLELSRTQVSLGGLSDNLDGSLAEDPAEKPPALERLKEIKDSGPEPDIESDAPAPARPKSR